MNGCSGALGTAAPEVRYEAVRAATGGVSDLICNAGPWVSLTDLGPAGWGYLRDFALSSAGLGVQDVRVGGISLPSSSYTHDLTTGVVSFDPSAVPEPSSVIEVIYSCP